MKKTLILGAAAVALLTPAVTAKQPRGIQLTPIGTFNSGLGAGAAEIAAYDPATQRLFVVNAATVTVDVLDILDPTAPTKIGQLGLSPFGGVANSVAVRDGLVAIAVEAVPKTNPGKVLLFDTYLNHLSGVTVGALPDMLTFSHDGRWILTANEGEPNSYNQPDSVDPIGSVSIINVSGGAAHVTQDDVRTWTSPRLTACRSLASASSDRTRPSRRIWSLSMSRFRTIPKRLG